MLFLQLCSIILYQFFQNVEPNQADILFPFQFGFKIDGKYTIVITNGGNDSFILIIQPENYFKYLKEDELHLACTDNNYTQNIHENYHVIHLKNGKYNISSSINQENIYKTSIQFCMSNHLGFKIEGLYMNPNSPFGYDKERVLKYLLIPIYIRIIIFIIWLINWISYFSMKNVLHLVFTFTAFIFIISKIIDYLDYRQKYESNQISLISIIRPYSDTLRDIIVLNTFFLINCCVSIVNNWKKTIYLKIIYLWAFYSIFYNQLYPALKKWVFYVIGLFAHLIVNNIIILISGVYNDNEFMIFLLNQLKSIFYVFLVITEKFDMTTEIEGYVVYDIYIIIMECIMAYFFRMRNITKNDYLKLFPHANNDNFHQFSPIEY